MPAGTTIRIKRLHPDAILPVYAHGAECDAGMDLHAIESVILHPGRPRLARTGISIELPRGFEAQIRPRSGLALKHGVTVLNSPGTVDPSFRGEIGVILINHNDIPHQIEAGDRIAQMVIARYEPVQWEEQEELSGSTRGEGGFGSSGMR